MDIAVFISSILIFLFTFPYGVWECENQNKIAGFFVYAISILLLISSIVNLFI